MSSSSMTLYVKTGCPWCRLAEQNLDQRGYHYQRLDVGRDPEAYDELERISGQHYTPTLAFENLLLTDFGPDELADFLKQHNILP